MDGVPTVLLTLLAHHDSTPDYMQSSHAWLTETTIDSFTYCVHESIFFAGAHKATVVCVIYSCSC